MRSWRSIDLRNAPVRDEHARALSPGRCSSANAASQRSTVTRTSLAWLLSPPAPLPPPPHAASSSEPARQNAHALIRMGRSNSAQRARSSRIAHDAMSAANRSGELELLVEDDFALERAVHWAAGDYLHQSLTLILR